MKKKEVLVYLNMEIEGKKVQIQFPKEGLRDWLNNLKLESDQETADLSFILGGKTYVRKVDVKKELPLIKKAVKCAELAQDIVPSYLAKYLVDYTQILSKKRVAPIVGREHEIEKAWFFLSKERRNNVFLTGEKDVGKTAIAIEIARQIATNECPKEFYEKRVLMLKPEMILKIESEYMYKRKIEQLITFLVNNKKDIILYADKALHLKTDVMLIYILYACLKKYNIPILTTSSEDNFDDYFYEDQSIAKYVNFIYVDEPDYEEIEPMIRRHIKRLEKQHGIKISNEMVKFGIFTSNLSDSVSANPGKVINIFERAFLEAKRKDKEEVDKVSILKCYNTQLKVYAKMPEEEKISTAYHETGHYILAVKSEHFKDIKISCVSNLPMSWWAGVTMPYYNYEEYAVHSREYYIDRIAFSLGGRIAERKFTGLNSTGAANDLEQANDVARAMIMKWGFSKNGQNINRQYSYKDYAFMPESKKELIDKEVQDIIDEATGKAEQIIDENEELLKIIAEKLYKEEILTGEQLEAICKEYEETKNNK